MSIPVVYDTMLFFQIAARPTRVHASFQAIRDARVTLYLSLELLAEVRDVLTRPEHQVRFPALTPEAVDAFIGETVSRSVLVDPVPMAFTWPQHPDDDHLFNLAIQAQARYLVTWETRLLNLLTDASSAANLLRKMAPNLSIITPKTLAGILQASPKPQ